MRAQQMVSQCSGANEEWWHQSERSRPAIIRVSFPLPRTHGGAGRGKLQTHAREIEKGKRATAQGFAGCGGQRYGSLAKFVGVGWARSISAYMHGLEPNGKVVRHFRHQIRIIEKR